MYVYYDGTYFPRTKTFGRVQRKKQDRNKKKEERNMGVRGRDEETYTSILDLLISL